MPVSEFLNEEPSRHSLFIKRSGVDCLVEILSPKAHLQSNKQQSQMWSKRAQSYVKNIFRLLSSISLLSFPYYFYETLKNLSISFFLRGDKLIARHFSYKSNCCQSLAETVQFLLIPLKKSSHGKKLIFMQQSIINTMENSNFRKLMALLEEKGDFEQILKLREEEYLIKLYRIGDLQPTVVSELYQNMQRKFYINRKKQQEEFWYENQLRIFIWLLFAYLYVFEKQITDLKEEDWNYFSNIFNYKSAVFFEFQTLSIIKAKGRPAAWCEEESGILQEIINQKKFKNRWNSIARQLFTKSGRRYFRNPKQCRERWMNHLDPSKLHSEWTISEDIVLLNTIRKRGKKWSLAVKELQNTRTEHMVKNRYKSLIANQSKKYPEKRQGEIQKGLIKRLQKMLEKTMKSEQQKGGQGEPILASIASLVDVKIQKPKEIVHEEIKHSQMKYQWDEHALHHMQFPCQESFGRSPLFATCKVEQMPKMTLNLMEDEKMEMEDHLYDYSSPENESFLRF